MRAGARDQDPACGMRSCTGSWRPKIWDSGSSFWRSWDDGFDDVEARGQTSSSAFDKLRGSRKPTFRRDRALSCMESGPCLQDAKLQEGLAAKILGCAELILRAEPLLHLVILAILPKLWNQPNRRALPGGLSCLHSLGSALSRRCWQLIHLTTVDLAGKQTVASSR